MSQSKLLTGTWKLSSAQFEFADTGERVDMYGPHPSGYLIVTEEGRTMVILARADRASPKQDADGAMLFKAMMAYTGNCTIEGDTFTTKVDVAWHPDWTGTEQTRFFKLDGDVLSIMTAQQTHPMYPGRMLRGILRYTRAG